MQPRKDKVRLTVECTQEERTYIKMLAAKKQMTISEYLLSYPRVQMPKSENIPNKTTVKAMEDAEGGKDLESFDDLDQFWDAMGMNPHA